MDRFVLLRIALGLLCLVFAFFFGRSLARPRRTKLMRTTPLSWALRSLVAGFGLAWQAGVDALVGGVLIAYPIVAAAGYFRQRKPPEPEEDLSKEMFPKD